MKKSVVDLCVHYVYIKVHRQYPLRQQMVQLSTVLDFVLNSADKALMNLSGYAKNIR
jgi:hypothetical protein